MSRPLCFEDLDVGHELLTHTQTLSSEEVRRYAVAARMAGRRFLNDEDARQEGLPGQIVPGNVSIALFARLIAESFPGATLKRLSATFRALVRPNHPITLRGVVTEKHCTDHGDLIECDLVLESAEGERWVTGTATVQLPSERAPR